MLVHCAWVQNVTFKVFCMKTNCGLLYYFFYLRRGFSFSAGELREAIGDDGINVAFICLQAPESWDVHSVLPSHLN